MKHCWTVLIFLLACSTSALSERMLPHIVSTQWLSEQSTDRDIVVLQVGFSRNEFKLGHIPGSRFLWFNWLAPSTPDLNSEMPSVADATMILEDLGITRRSKIVLVFTGQNVSITTRMYLAFCYFGFEDRTAILDGGFERWKAEGRPVSKEMPDIKRSSLSLQTHPDIIVNAEWIRQNLDNAAVTIVDVRTKNFYDGSGGGIARQGHIKGAKHLVFNTVLDSTGTMKPAAELRSLFEAAGIAGGTTIVTYCHVGQQASLIFFAAQSLGYRAKMYDGSFEDWNVRDETYPVEKTTGP